MYRTQCVPVGRNRKEIDNHMPPQEMNYRLRLGRGFKIPEFLLPPSVGILATACSPDSGRKTQKIPQRERAQFGESEDLISGPCNAMTVDLSLDPSESQFPPQLNENNGQIVYWGCKGHLNKYYVFSPPKP